MYDPIPQPRARLGWKPHPLHTWNLGTVDYPQLGSGPLLAAIPSHFSINGIFFRRPSPQDPGKSSGASSRGPGIPRNLGPVDHIAHAIQRWNYCQVHEPFTCSQCSNTEPLFNQAKSLESVVLAQLSPHKLSGYRPTTSFIDANTQDIICHKMQIP